MSQSNYITLTGYVTAEPRLGFTKASKMPVTKIRVGSTPRWLDRGTGEWRDGETSYYSVRCWRKLAENVTGSLRKGDMILVRGKFRTRTWVDDQQRTRIELEVDADSVGHDMSYGWSHFNRGVHVPPGANRAQANGEALRQQMTPDNDLPEDAEFADGPDEYDGSYGNLPGDDGFDGDGPAAGSAPAGPDDPPQGAPRLSDGEGDRAEDSAFAELTREFGHPAEQAAQL
jgi:single-strand DNA-binding protein